MLGGDACAEILDEKLHGVGNGACAEYDSSTRRAVLQRVVDQVGKDLVNGFAVGKDCWEIFGRWVGAGKAAALGMVRRGILNLQVLYLQFNSVSAGDFAKAFFGVVEKFGGRNGLRIKTGFPG